MKTLRCTLVAGALAAAFSAHAEISFNGFASIGAGTLSNDSVSYNGYDSDFSLAPDTNIGLQFSSQLSDKISVTAQLLASGNNDYSVGAEWIYFSYAISDDWEVRAGRLRAPLFFYSDYLDVGYAYPWIRPPVETYRFPFDTVDGIDTLYNTSVGNWDLSWHGYYGRLSDSTPIAGQDVDFELKNFTGINLTASYDWLTLRAAYNRADLSFPGQINVLVPLIDSLNTAGFGSLAALISPGYENTGEFISLAANIDYNDWLMLTEFTLLNMEQQTMQSDDTAWYITLGRRFDEFTLHLTYAQEKDDPDFSVSNVIPVGIAPQLDALKAAFDNNVIANEKNTTVTLGLRYDFAPSTAFKVEISRISQESEGDLGFQYDNSATLVSAAFELVF